MRMLFSFIIVIVMAMTASAQITWNVKVGGGLAMCTGDIDGDMKGKFVGKIGVGMEKPLNINFSLMPSLEIALKGTKFSDDYYTFAEKNLSALYVQIPVLAAYRLNLNDDWNLTLKAGPYFACGISSKYKYLSYSDHYHDFDIFSDEFAKRFDVGVDVGIDFEYHRFVFGLEYERGFVSVVNIYNQAIYATAGYKF